MKKHYSISVPKPCHEDWNAMTPKEKGRHCNSCVKTVIDFTKMNTLEIQDFIHENRNNKICGHFKQTQLDSINIHIPSQVFEKQINFHKLFLLALLITMGTSLLNCTNKNGAKQKIDSIEVIDSINNKTIDILGGLHKIEHIDSIPKKACKTNTNKKEVIEIPTIDGEIISTLGDVDIPDSIHIDSLETPVIDITGITAEAPEIEDEIVVGYVVVETPPQFKDTPKALNRSEKKEYFSKRVSQIVSKNFNQKVCIGLQGRQRIQVQFKINTLGNVVDVKVRAPHPALEKEAKRVIQLLPHFIPAHQRGKPIKIVYSLPIIFQIDE